MRPKAILTIVALGMSYAPAHARSLHIGGTAGYLSEWEINATVAEDESDGGSLHGPVTLKHTGLCAVKGPVEKSGELRGAAESANIILGSIERQLRAGERRKLMLANRAISSYREHVAKTRGTAPDRNITWLC